ncbi:2-keto-4-pentenoate hydratase [Psittacicella melopsittaci]|uniref:2-keto-4-pentenoate hydratase n=1 Tax=Psittacicella melopsittaci TaxID=2028576 RepID=A0A3A1Y0L3_9GAMM|nr:2-keto-4-pentenoate hydratase [Psittacicella melopsittaci]RIY31882.1 2-keto-4-pentenoate hydratase [Psittacicella melopsittaci]
MTQLNLPQLTEQQEKFAQELAKAYKENKALVKEEWLEVVTDDDQAYAVQAKFTSYKDTPVGGYKVSLTSKRTQELFNSDSPLYGALEQTRFVQGPATLELSNLNEALVECELVFKAKEDLLPTDTLEDLARKTTVAAGLEVPDARFAAWFPSLAKHLVVSDGSVGGFVVYGEEHDTTALFPNVEDLAKVTMRLTHNDKELATGVSSEVLDNPLNSLHWLVQKLHAQGFTFKAGLRVSSGTFNFPPNLEAGVWEAEYGSGVGKVTLTVK